MSTDCCRCYQVVRSIATTCQVPPRHQAVFRRESSCQRSCLVCPRAFPLSSRCCGSRLSSTQFFSAVWGRLHSQVCGPFSRRNWYTMWTRQGRCCQFGWCLVSTLQMYSVSQQKIPPPKLVTFFHFFRKLLNIFKRFFTHLLYVPIFARLQIFIQLYPTLPKLCHIKRNCFVHVMCSKCPSSAETHALTRLRKSLIALLIVVCGKSL